MSKERNDMIVSSKQENKMYPTEKLLKSKCLSGYQPDFARAILTKPEYSISGAMKTLESKLKGGQ